MNSLPAINGLSPGQLPQNLTPTPEILSQITGRFGTPGNPMGATNLVAQALASRRALAAAALRNMRGR